MSDLNIIDSVITVINNFSLAEAQETLLPLIFFILGMFIYSIFVFKFYKFIARKDIFRVSKGESTSAHKKLVYTLEYIFLFPVIAFFWFLIISILLSILSEVLTIGNILMVSMATLATIRLTAYYTEELSRDIAKLIPFALLAVLLLDITTITAQAPADVIRQVMSQTKILVYYFGFVVVLEFVLRIIFHRNTQTPQSVNNINTKTKS